MSRQGVTRARRLVLTGFGAGRDAHENVSLVQDSGDVSLGRAVGCSDG
jgi:hypothetical protein